MFYGEDHNTAQQGNMAYMLYKQSNLQVQEPILNEEIVAYTVWDQDAEQMTTSTMSIFTDGNLTQANASTVDMYHFYQVKIYFYHVIWC